MQKSFFMKLLDIQPSQLYINRNKLESVKQRYSPLRIDSLPPIPVKKNRDNIFFTDGHTRAFAALLEGFKEILVVWEDVELDWEMYEICINWCKEEKIFNISDLKEKVVDNDRYKALWIDRCEKLEDNLEKKRQCLRY